MIFTFGNLPALGWHEPTAKIVELARICEDVGFDRFGVADYRFYHDASVIMTACLQATRGLALETLVTDPYVRHPSLVAAAYGTMDDLAPGRVILGLGGGLEQPAFWGEERLHPIDAVREAVEICRALWRGEEVNLDGRVLRVQGARLNFTARPNIPVLIAARGQRMLRLAGEIADVVHLAAWFLNVAHYRDNVAEVRRGAERGGRSIEDFEIDLSVPMCVSTERPLARRAAKRFAARGILWMAGAEEYSRDRSDWQPPAEFHVSPDVVRALATGWDTWREPDLPDHLAELIDDNLVDQFTVAGEPDECAERVYQLLEARPEVTGVRIQAFPPHGRSTFDGYVETVRGTRQAIVAAAKLGTKTTRERSTLPTATS